MKKSMAVAMAISLVFVCVTLAGRAESAPKVMRVGTIQSTEHPYQKALEKFKELVKQKTNGEIEVRIFPMAQLGSGPTQIQSVKLGTLESFVEGSGMYANMVGEFALFTAAYVFDRADVIKMWEGPIGKELNEMLIKKHGIRMLCTTWERGPRHLLSVRPMLTVADVKGLKLRVPQDVTFLASWKMIGASPTPINMGEVYLALQQGIVEAEENPLETHYTMKFYEAAKNLSLTAHVIENAGFSINEKFYQGLTNEQRTALSEAAKEAGKVNNEMTTNLDTVYRKKMEDEGVKFHMVDRASFRAACKEAPRQVEASGLWTKGYYDRVLDFLKQPK
jgi:tripartite ATP-independent transporter DctP family solute receptor